MYYQMQTKHTKGKKSFLLSPFPGLTFIMLKKGRTIFSGNFQYLCSWIGAVDWKS